MINESEFDNEFKISKEEAWLYFGVTNPEDWDTVD